MINISKKSNYEKAWNRWVEEVDMSEFTDAEEVWDAFSEWLPEQVGKVHGLDRFKEFVEEKWESFVQELPDYEQLWLKEVAPEIPEEYREKGRSWFEKVMSAENEKQAFEYFYRMPTRIWRALPIETIKELREKILSYFL